MEIVRIVRRTMDTDMGAGIMVMIMYMAASLEATRAAEVWINGESDVWKKEKRPPNIRYNPKACQNMVGRYQACANL